MLLLAALDLLPPALGLLVAGGALWHARRSASQARHLRQELRSLRHDLELAEVANNHTGNFLGTLDREGRVLLANRTSLEVIGGDPTPVLGVPFPDTPWWTHAPAEQERLRRAIATAASGTEDAFTTTHSNQDGDLLYVEFRIHPVKGPDGEVRYLVPEGRDVTDLHQADAFGRIVLDAAPVGQMLITPDGHILRTNPALDTLFGYEAGVLQGQPIERLVPEAVAPGHAAQVRAYLDDPTPRLMAGGRDLPALHRTGRQFTVEVGLTPVAGSEGDLVLASVVDATQRRRTEEMVRVLFENGTDPQVLYDAQGVISLNPAAVHAFGLSTADAAQGRPVLEIAPGTWSPDNEDDATPEADVFSLHALETPQRFTWLLQGKGQVIPCEVSIVPVTLSTGPGALAVWHDLRLRLQIEDRLRVRNEELRHLLHVVSHDLKSPVVTIAGFTGLLDAYLEAGDMDQVRDASQRIQRSVHTLQALLGDLVELNRLGRGGLQQQEVDPALLTKEAIEVLDAERTARGATCRFEGEVLPIIADRDLLLRALLNLIQNAIKYGGGATPPEVTVRTRRRPGRVELSVQDNGPGVPTEAHKRVFRLFQRLQVRGEGTGVGLATVARIMDLHEGECGVETPPEGGARFWLAFPENAGENPGRS